MPMKFEPKPYQQEIWEKTREDANHALFLDPGLGKTKVLLDTAFWLYEQGKLDGLIVVSHISVAENWYINEIPKHKWENVRSLMYRAQTPASKTAKLLEKGMFNILLTNKETLRSKKHMQTLQRLVDSGRWMFCVDESTCIKNPQAQQTKGALSLGSRAQYNRILSGEPMTNSPLDLLGQYKLILPEVFGKMSKTAFIQRFCSVVNKRYGGRQFQEVTGWSPSGKEMFEKLVARCTTRLTKAQAGLDLPPCKVTKIPIQMTPLQINAYQQMLHQSQVDLRNGEKVTVDVVVAKMIKLHQITSGLLRDEEGNWIEMESPKLKALGELVDKYGREPMVIWCNYRKDVERVTAFLQEKHGDFVSMVYGGLTAKQRMQALEDFANGTNPWLVANPQSIGWGLTLTQACKAVYYSHSYNYELRKQSEDRIHRIGQEAEQVDYFNLVVEDTIDSKIVQAVERKRKEAGEMFQNKETITDLAQQLFGVTLNAAEIADEIMEVEI